MSDAVLRTILNERIERLESLLEKACARSGRPRSAVTLVAVTKAAPDAVLHLLPELGLHHLGENRPQELWRKVGLLEGQVNWHLIGHLQRNKAERTLPLVSLIHSVDSVRLLQAIDDFAKKAGRCTDVLLEVNTSAEASKHGFRPEDVPSLPESMREMDHVRVLGLMTMAAPTEDADETRPCFALLRRVRDLLRTLLPGGHPCTELSMGMSGDFEVAIEEGATLVRIGSALFERLS